MRLRSIVHLDADAFFAAVEQASDPNLRGKAIAVGGEKRGIIASASYEARAFGVYTPMPTAHARKLCPKLIVLPGDFERYEQFSNWMFGYCYDFTPEVEQTSIDEGYFDLTSSRKPAVEVAEKIRKAIRQKLKITVSEGIASNKLVSAIASKLNKPSAFSEIRPGSEKEFLHPLANKWLPGVGPKTSVRLNAAGLARISQIALTPPELLELILGRQAMQIRQFAQGIDPRPLVLSPESQKSYSKQETFKEDLTDESYLSAVLRRMADELFADVRAERRSIRTLTVKVRYNDMAEDQVSESLLEPTDLEAEVYGRLETMLRTAWKRRVSVRLVSLKLSNLYDSRFRSELALGNEGIRREARSRLAGVVDLLRKTHGDGVILHGHDFRLREPPSESAKVTPTPLVNLPSVSKAIAPRTTTSVPLRVHSYYSFLDSTLSPAEVVRLAHERGFPAVALTDYGNLHGACAFAEAAKSEGVKAIFGTELRVGSAPLLLYVQNQTGYANLCRLLSLHANPTAEGDGISVASRQRAPLREALLHGLTDGLLAVSSDPTLAKLFPGRFYLGGELARRGSLPHALCPPVFYADASDRLRYDIVQSIRTLTLLRQPHPEKRAQGGYHFRSSAELSARFKDTPASLHATVEIAERCEFEFPLGKPQFPPFHTRDGSSSKEFLKRTVLNGLKMRYDGKKILSERKMTVSMSQVIAQVETELSIITEVGYEDLFLSTWELLQVCRQHGIEWITRGSAADSLVCYCLSISEVCPIRFGLYFRRFLNKERMALHKLPDIDIDFPHDRKDDVVNLLFARHGKEHCAVVGGFSTFQARSAVADVAKVLGVSEHQIRRFTERFPWSFGGGWVSEDHHNSRGADLLALLRASPECRDMPLDEEPFKTAVETAAFLDGFPRHPKMHPCGVVLSKQPMHELTPTFTSNKGWPTTHFDMDAVEEVGLVKTDILAQGGLAVMRDVRDSLASKGIKVDLAALEPWEDQKVWDMISSGGARAVHHIESPAMTNLCQMCHVGEIDGLVAIVSVIRPGAANEQKKVKFTRRYQGFELPEYPDPSLEPCLRSTFGLVVYEEHILQMCEAFAGLSPGRADVLRRSLVKQKWKEIEVIGKEFTASALERDHPPEKIKEVWELVTGFNGYAFCKAHSTAYGVEAYQAAWLKLYHPAEFMAAVLTNAKGFYHPIVYVLETRRLGIGFLPPSVNEPGPAFVPQGNLIRVPLTRAKGLTQNTCDRMVAARREKKFTSIHDFFRRVAPSGEELEIMLRAGGFDEFGETRTNQFWQAQYLLKTFTSAPSARQGWLIPPAGLDRLPEIPLKEPTRQERLVWEAELYGYAVSAHPLELFPDIAWESYCPVNRLGEFVGRMVKTCGLIVEQRTHHQITGEPMKFLSLADHTGIIETELFAQTYKTYGLATVRYPVLEVEAKVEPFENGRGFSLRVLKAGEPRKRSIGSI